jgi:hypothetical protein
MCRRICQIGDWCNQFFTRRTRNMPTRKLFPPTGRFEQPCPHKSDARTPKRLHCICMAPTATGMQALVRKALMNIEQSDIKVIPWNISQSRTAPTWSRRFWTMSRKIGSLEEWTESVWSRGCQLSSWHWTSVRNNCEPSFSLWIRLCWCSSIAWATQIRTFRSLRLKPTEKSDQSFCSEKIDLSIPQFIGYICKWCIDNSKPLCSIRSRPMINLSVWRTVPDVWISPDFWRY